MLFQALSRNPPDIKRDGGEEAAVKVDDERIIKEAQRNICRRASFLC
ncbi:hypothetical protein HMPREF3220_04667 [Citrobacter koseri]|nr:hypothetical protein HMPREF3220_04667 [Citrobacter koseri]KWZ98687.1 hypothetical protein HMPREF3207_04023 [Citrobacter koseri]